jgi:transcriptional regulator with XRE-family HTH domain
MLPMTPQELIALRAHLGWDRTKLARRLGISPSRLADFERGCSRGKHSRPAPIPTVVELACRWLDEHEAALRPMAAAERAVLWRDDRLWPRVDHIVDDSRDGIYGYSPDRRTL